jgi:hypothetical protein
MIISSAHEHINHNDYDCSANSATDQILGHHIYGVHISSFRTHRCIVRPNLCMSCMHEAISYAAPNRLTLPMLVPAQAPEY